MELITKSNFSEKLLNYELKQPKPMRGGSYISYLVKNDKNVFVQVPKCNTKQGIVTSGKKMYCDLLFSSTNEEHLKFIQWIENLESKCHNLIYDKKDMWFNEDFDLNDIETNFTSPIRIYKSGKYYLLRVQFNNLNKKNDCSVYNENEEMLDINEVKDDMQIVSLLQFKGVRFTTKSFHFDIVMKQIMVLENENEKLKKCLIRKDNDMKNDKMNENEKVEIVEHLEKSDDNHSNDNHKLESEIVEHLEKSDNKMNKDQTELSDNLKSVDNKDDNDDKELHDNNTNNELNETVEMVLMDNMEEKDDSESTNLKKDNEYENLENNNDENILDEVQLDKETLEKTDLKLSESNENEDLSEPNENEDSSESNENEDSSESNENEDKTDKLDNLNEFEIDLDNLKPMEVKVDDLENEELKLKEPNEVYIEIYKAAKEKAKKARKMAVETYLEAMNIKNTYMLDDIDSSDDEFNLDELTQ